MKRFRVNQNANQMYPDLVVWIRLKALYVSVVEMRLHKIYSVVTLHTVNQSSSV